MSTHRNIDRICIVVLVLTLLLTVGFINGEKLGIRAAADEDAESYSGGAYFTANDLDGEWAENAYTTNITLSGSGGKIDGSGAYFLDGDLVISSGGWYEITGFLEDGKIVVDAYDSSKIWIRLCGVTITCSDDACLRIDQADKVFLTLAEGTENTMTSGSSYSEDALSDNTGGTIFSHDDLTINGSGSLTVTAGYRHGIDVNDSLAITGGIITVSAPQDGIHVADSFRFAGAELTIDAGDDGIHSDGEIYIESGTILLASCYEGLEAVTVDLIGGDITICSTDDGINANGGNSTADYGGMGKGPGADAGENPEGKRKNGMPAFLAGLEGLAVGEDGSIAPDEDTAESILEALSREGSSAGVTAEEIMSCGTIEDLMELAGLSRNTGEKGIPSGPEEEGMPQAPGTAAGQAETIQTGDGNSSGEEEAYIRMCGGTLTVINETGQDADGLDSNGSIYIEGGDIRISILGDGTNCAIDYGSESGGECIVTGGTVLAFGGSGMAEGFSEGCTQCSVLYSLDSAAPAGTLFCVLNAEGEEILSFSPVCSYSSVSFSIPELTVGESYTIICGNERTELTLESYTVTAGKAGGMSVPLQPESFGNRPDQETGFSPEGPGNGGETGSSPALQPGQGRYRESGPDGQAQDEGTGNASYSSSPLGEIDRNAWILLGTSALLLAAALLFAGNYRRSGR